MNELNLLADANERGLRYTASIADRRVFPDAAAIAGSCSHST